MKNSICKFCMLIIILFMCLFNVSNADVGNYESYDSDFGSDWGSDYDYGTNYYGGVPGDELSFGEAAILLFIIVIIFVYCKKNNIKLNSRTTTNYNYSKHKTNVPVNSKNVLAQIKATDTYFNEANFLSWAKNLFVKLQNAWTARDWETIRTLETKELFEQHSNQLKQYIENKQINVMDRIAVNYAKLYSFEQDNDKDTLSIILNSSMLDYIIDEETKKLLQGSKTTRRTNTYLMTFIRKKGVKTKESTDELETTNCPNCGAPTTILSSGKCEYCGSIINTGEHDWVLSNLEPFRG